MNENQDEGIRTPKAQIAIDEEYIRRDEDFGELDEGIRSRLASLDLKSGKVPFIVGGVVIVLLIILGAIFLGGSDKKTSEELITILAKVKQLETRVTRLDEMDARVTLLEKQDNEMQQFIKEMDRIERSLKKGVDKLAKDLDRLQKRKVSAPAKTKVPRATQKKPVKVEAPRATQKEPVKVEVPTAAQGELITRAPEKYHEVRPGDTLYRIALKSGISVDKLCRLNNITPNTVIHAGQKLLVSSGTDE